MSPFEALGTVWSFELYKNAKSNKVEQFLKDKITTYENNYSRFKEGSLLTLLNRQRQLKKASNELIELLEFGKRLYTQTNGYFNCMLGNVLIERGYGENFSESLETKIIPNPENDIVVHGTDIFLLGSATLDLGGYAKGYLVDLLAKSLRNDWNMNDFIINAGGDIYIANGDNKSTEIVLEHPTDKGINIGAISLKNAGFCASSDQKRRWFNAAKQKSFTHIIKENEDESDTSTASFVISPSVALADAIATTLLIVNGEYKKLPIALFTHSSFLLVKENSIACSPNFPKVRQLQD